MSDMRHWTRIYVAAPFQDKLYVRNVVHRKLVEAELRPVSTWANSDAEEDFQDEQVLANAICENDTQLACCDAVLVLARPGAGGEMFAEARIALVWGKPVFWVGRRVLTTFRRGVVRFADMGKCVLASGGAFEREIDRAIAAIKGELA